MKNLNTYYIILGATLLTVMNLIAGGRLGSAPCETDVVTRSCHVDGDRENGILPKNWGFSTNCVEVAKKTASGTGFLTGSGKCGSVAAPNDTPAWVKTECGISPGQAIPCGSDSVVPENPAE